MTRPFRICVLTVLFTALSAAATAAQEAAAPDALAAIRTKEGLTDADRDAIRVWVEERVAQARGSDGTAASQAVRDLRAADAGSEAFRRALGEALKQSVGRAYRGSEPGPAARLLIVLGLYNQPETCDLFIEALSDDRPPVRCAAAIALRNLRARLAMVGGRAVADTLAALREAALRETSAETLRALYQAMNFAELPSPPDPQANVDALVALLEARSEQYVSGRVRAYGADDTGLAILYALRARLSERQRQQVIVLAGRMLRYAIGLYISAAKGPDGVILPASTPREQTELLIREAERLLRELLAPPADRTPRIVEGMQKVNTTTMQIEFNKWGELVKAATGVEIFLDAAASQPAGDGG